MGARTKAPGAPPLGGNLGLIPLEFEFGELTGRATRPGFDSR